MSYRKVIFLLCLIFSVHLLQTYFNIAMSTYYGKSYPYSTPLFDPSQRFNDFIPIYMQGALVLKGGNPYTDKYMMRREVPPSLEFLPERAKRMPLPQAYFPLANLIGALFALMNHSMALCLFFSITIIGSISALLFQATSFLDKTHRFPFLIISIPLTLLSYPFIFMLDRGNLEGIVLLFVWFYVLLYKKKYSFSWILLGMMVMIKPQTGILGFLPMIDRNYGHVIKSILLSFAIFFFCLFILPGSCLDSLKGLKSALDWFYSNHLIQEATIRYNHTLFGLLKGLVYQFGHLEILPHIRTLSICLGVLLGCVSILSMKMGCEKNYDLRILNLIIVMIVLPEISFDYTLIQLFPPFFLLLGTLFRENISPKKIFLYLLVLTFIIIPKQWFISTQIFPYGPSYIINTTLLLFLLMAVSWQGSLFNYSWSKNE